MDGKILDNIEETEVLPQVTKVNYEDMDDREDDDNDPDFIPS